MKTESLLDRVRAERDTAERDFWAANAALAPGAGDQQLHDVAIDARMEAAKRWTAANVEIRRYEHMGSNNEL